MIRSGIMVFVMTAACLIVGIDISLPDPSKVAFMESLFDRQMVVLKARGVPQKVIAEFKIHRGEVVARASMMEIPEGHIPFLPVIPLKYVADGKCVGTDIGWQGGDWEGYKPNSGLGKGIKFNVSMGDLYGMKELYEVVPTVYFIYDISYGKNDVGKSPKLAREEILKSERYPLTAMEGVSLYLLSPALSEWNLWFAGTECKSGDVSRVPTVKLVKDQKGADFPVVEFIKDDEVFSNFATPSYSER